MNSDLRLSQNSSLMASISLGLVFKGASPSRTSSATMEAFLVPKSPPRLRIGSDMTGRLVGDDEDRSETSAGSVGRPVGERGKRRCRRRE